MHQEFPRLEVLQGNYLVIKKSMSSVNAHECQPVSLPQLRPFIGTEPSQGRMVKYSAVSGCFYGGGRGIRTLGALARPLGFKTSAFNHSAIPPDGGRPGSRGARNDSFLSRRFQWCGRWSCRRRLPRTAVLPGRAAALLAFIASSSATPPAAVSGAFGLLFLRFFRLRAAAVHGNRAVGARVLISMIAISIPSVLGVWTILMVLLPVVQIAAGSFPFLPIADFEGREHGRLFHRAE